MNYEHWNYSDAEARFTVPTGDARLSVYLDIPALSSAEAERFLGKNLRLRIERLVNHCRKNDVGCLLPRLKDTAGLTEEHLETLKTVYALLLAEGKRRGVSVGFNPEKAYQNFVYDHMAAEDASRLRGEILNVYEYLCDVGSTVRYKLHPGKLMSVVAFDEDRTTPDIIDLRDKIEDGKVVYTLPSHGNYRILEYVCEPDPNAQTTNYLSYDASSETIRRVWSLFEDTLGGYAGDVLDTLEYHEISFDAKNRRSWCSSFNEVFAERFGFDPAPYYPALFSDIGHETTHLRALFFTCRSAMLKDGFLAAMNDFAKEKGLSLFGSVTEPKLSACPWITGDNLLSGSFAPGALLDKAYLYGTNSLKIAAAAAYNFDFERVSCELYRDYYRASHAIFYNDAMNALARGANRLTAHIPELRESEDRNMLKSMFASHWEHDFANYIGRVQTLLSGGRHISDIAMLYPIDAISAKTTFYVSKASLFEYPKPPSNADYMTLIHSISTYGGHDLTILHPETVTKRCTVENGVLTLHNEKNTEQFRILLMPAGDLIRLENLEKAAKFFDGGGKIIATGTLPSYAFEFMPTFGEDKRRQTSHTENDKRVTELVAHIFGKEAAARKSMHPFFYNTNDAGGEAYFLPFTSTAADGTATTKSRLVSEALHSFALPLDIYMPDMPRLECVGALNSVFPEFRTLGLAESIPGGGMLNHIHKKRGSTDIYYFSNTTSNHFNSYLLLRGELNPEEWNPHDGKIRKVDHSIVTFRDQVYTKITLDLGPSQSILFVSDPNHTPEHIEEHTAPEENLTEIEGIVGSSH